MSNREMKHRRHGQPRHGRTNAHEIEGGHASSAKEMKMAFTSKVNNAGLFVNDRAPEKSDYTGQIEIMCPKCGVSSQWWISGWKRTAKSGVKYLSLALRPKGAPAEQAHNGAEDKIPF